MLLGPAGAVSCDSQVLMMAFSSVERTFVEGLMIHSTLALFFFFKSRSACTHQVHFLGQDQSIVAQRAEMTVAKYS